MRPRFGLILLAVGVALSLAPRAANALCAAQTEAEAGARANVVFEGIAQPGPQTAAGFLESPARFSVLRYLKGSGPSVVSVAVPPQEDGISVHSGERWVIYGNGAPEQVIPTSKCAGSHLAGAGSVFVSPTPTPTLSPTLPPIEAPVLHSEVGWGVKTAAGVIGLALVMGIGYGVARVIVGTR